MADEKKIKNEELTDEQANEAAGGFGSNEYRCQGGCGRKYSGKVPFYVNNRPYCVNCYGKYQQEQNNTFARVDHHGRSY